MKELYIYHHLGLGDHIICNAIVRNYAKLCEKIHLFVKPHNLNNVKFMYRDLTNIDYIVGDDTVANDFLRNNSVAFLKVGHEKLDLRYKFDESFYKSIGMDFEKKWSDFYLERDLDKEKQLFDSLNLKENEYIFINEDISRGFVMDKNKYMDDMRVVSSELPCALFDLCYIIENANEVHLMESSIKCLSDHLNIKTDKLFYHAYVRNYPFNVQVTSKRNWVVL